MPSAPINLAILGSTRGSNLLPILEAIKTAKLNADIQIVVSNKSNAGILQKAKDADIPHQAIMVDGRDRETYDREVDAVLRQHPVDLIVMIGYMRIVSDWFVDQWRGRMINVHPSLLPKHKGLMDLQVHQAVLDANESETGCSVHLVDVEVDGGDVLVQKTCQVSPDDSAETLKAKVQVLEGEALIEAVGDFKKA